MTGSMWMGNLQHAQWVPCPATGAQRSRTHYEERQDFMNGGVWIDRSTGGSVGYQFDFPVQDASEYDGIEAFTRFQSGEYGTDYIRFIDPMVRDQNLFNEAWAAPGLAEVGAKAIGGSTVAYTDTNASDVANYGYPARSAVFTITGPPASPPVDTGLGSQNSTFTLLVPSGYALHMGAYGATTGDGELYSQTYSGGVWAAPATVTLGSGAPSFTETFTGVDAVRFFIGRSTSNASTVTLAGLWAQVWPTGVTPSIARFIPGKGHSGLVFTGGGRVENYVMTDRHLVGASIALQEVEPWR